MLSPCSLAQHSPGWQSLDVLHRLLSVPLVLGARHRPHKHFNPLQQFPSLLQISFRIRHRSHLREYRLHDSLLSQSLLEVHIWFEMNNMINSFVKKYIQFTFLLREKWKGKKHVVKDLPTLHRMKNNFSRWTKEWYATFLYFENIFLNSSVWIWTDTYFFFQLQLIYFSIHT